MHYSTQHVSSIIAAHLQHYNRTDQPISLLFLTIVIISFQLYSAEHALQQYTTRPFLTMATDHNNNISTNNTYENQFNLTLGLE